MLAVVAVVALGASWGIAAPGQVGADPVGPVQVFGGDIHQPTSSVTGPDGNLWFVDVQAVAIGRITPAGAVSSFALPSGTPPPSGIAAGADGNLWFSAPPAIGKITTAGVITIYTDPAVHDVASITAGPDHNMWFAALGSGSLGRITPAGVITMFGAGCFPFGVTAGADGNLWVSCGRVFLSGGQSFGQYGITRVSPSGSITSFDDPAIVGAGSITLGPDGNAWFANGPGSIGRITPTGVATALPLGIPGALGDVAAGPDGNVWFTEPVSSTIGWISPSGVTGHLTDPLIHFLSSVTAGPDGAVWFTNGYDTVGRFTTGPTPTSTTTTTGSTTTTTADDPLPAVAPATVVATPAPVNPAFTG